MARKRYTAEQIIGHLRQAEILISAGKTIIEAARHLGVSEQTYYRWRKEYGGMEVAQVHRLKELEQVRRTQRYTPGMANDEVLLTTTIVSLARHYGRYGYRRITAMLRADGWGVNHKRVERSWRQEGLTVPTKQPKRGRVWLQRWFLYQATA